MDFNLTEQEQKELRDRAIAKVEERLTNEIFESMKRTVTRDVMNDLYGVARTKLREMLQDTPTQEKLQKVIEHEIGLLKKNNVYGTSPIREEVDKAIYRVAAAHTEAVAKELRNLLHAALKKGFYNPDEVRKENDDHQKEKA